MTYIYPTNVTNLAGYLRYADIVTGHLFGIAILLCVFVILLVRMKDYPLTKSFGSAAFATGILAILFRAIGLVSDLVVMFAVGLIIVGFIMLQRDE